MKRLLTLILAFICLTGCAYGDSLATPTDLCEFDDNDWGNIDFELERKVYLELLNNQIFYGQNVTLVAILIDFKDTDIYYFQWEESENGEEWWVIQDENQNTYTFILDQSNITHYWRVKVILEEG